MRRYRRAFSLLEIILALAILAGAVAVLGQLSRDGLENARLARDLTQAQLYCESKMAEIAAGLVSPTSVSDTPVEDGSDEAIEGWLCSIEVSSASQSGLLSVRVTVHQDPSIHASPVDYSLMRWILDPNTTSSSTTDTASAGAVP